MGLQSNGRQRCCAPLKLVLGTYQPADEKGQKGEASIEEGNRVWVATEGLPKKEHGGFASPLFKGLPGTRKANFGNFLFGLRQEVFFFIFKVASRNSEDLPKISKEGRMGVKCRRLRSAVTAETGKWFRIEPNGPMPCQSDPHLPIASVTQLGTATPQLFVYPPGNHNTWCPYSVAHELNGVEVRIDLWAGKIQVA